jgi:hypothetical protein
VLTIEFNGWFQCRLATDPDPYDEPRGVSGYVHAHAGEPDLDRIVHWQPPTFSRALAPRIRVLVSRVVLNGQVLGDSPLIGAKVMLHGSPKFEGRNGVVAEDGFEPIYPFDLEVTNGSISLRRAFVPYDQSFPFEGILSTGVDRTPAAAADIQKATGITSLLEVWRERLLALEQTSTPTEPARTATRERIRFLKGNLSGERTEVRFSAVRMHYGLPLNSGSPSVAGLAQATGFDPEVHDAWQVRFWLGGWDADVLCAFCSGRLSIPPEAESIRAERLPAGVHRDMV